MRSVCYGDHSSAVVLHFFANIRLESYDDTCIYSPLLHVLDQAKQLGIVTLCIAFDKLFWQRAVDLSN